ncbi:hypothetical protein E4U24_000533 [Claviceps purpurea]|nr:hypothetical protein E4U24_000533 [Claviceps purpurea]
MMRVGGEAVIWLTKGDRQVLLRDDGWMGRRYACLRQLRQIQSRSDSWVGRRYKSLRRTLLGRGPSDNRPPLRWPTEFDLSIVRAAVEDVVDKAEVRRIKRNTLRDRLADDINRISVPQDGDEVEEDGEDGEDGEDEEDEEEEEDEEDEEEVF